ncbi:hypothetical protein DPMN_015252 [Dreissena polymorpha]|uniref:Uncharacterized protein n=1 Tax=Dreissena polymorpha TaxID=45954 RepID=A0A9D4S5E4_DREPO|nr:hypothetical protein DPMN_015252 [Dreissena polymorpha]
MLKCKGGYFNMFCCNLIQGRLRQIAQSDSEPDPEPLSPPDSAADPGSEFSGELRISSSSGN